MKLVTEYQNNMGGDLPPSLANIEAKIGAAADGEPNKVYSFSGKNAINDAITVFKEGPLVDAIVDAFNAGSSQIKACRIGSCERASITLKDVSDTEAIRIHGQYSAEGNKHYVNVSHKFSNYSMAKAYLVDASYTDDDEVDHTVFKLAWFSSLEELLGEQTLAAEIAFVTALCTDDIFSQFNQNTGFRILGNVDNTGSPGNTKIWHYNKGGTLVAEDTVDITSILSTATAGAAIGICISSDEEKIWVSTATHLMRIDVSDPSTPALETTIAYAADLGIASPDISSIGIERDPNDEPNIINCYDKTGKKIYRVNVDEDSLEATLDIATLVGSDTVAGLSVENGSKYLYLALNGSSNDRLYRLRVVWGTTPEFEILGYSNMFDEDVLGFSTYIESCDVDTTISIQDRNQSPIETKEFIGHGTLDDPNSDLVEELNQNYEAYLLSDTTTIINRIEEDDSSVAPEPWEPFTGGTDASTPTNGDYLNGLNATKEHKDIAWIHPVGADTLDLWVATLIHCKDMFEDYKAERFALLELPEFSFDGDFNSAEYLSAVMEWMAMCLSMMKAIADKNAIPIAGSGIVMNPDGTKDIRHLAASIGGTIANLPVHKSWVNKPLRNIIPREIPEESLIPKITQEDVDTLNRARINTVQYAEGRGYVISDNLTGDVLGSDYSQANDLRVIYAMVKDLRVAFAPFFGEENETEADLEPIRNAGEKVLDKYSSNVSRAELKFEPDGTQLNVSLGVKTRKATKTIWLNVQMNS